MGAPLQTGEAGRAHGAPRSGPPRRRPEVRPAPTAPREQARAHGAAEGGTGSSAGQPHASPCAPAVCEREAGAGGATPAAAARTSRDEPARTCAEARCFQGDRGCRWAARTPRSAPRGSTRAASREAGSQRSGGRLPPALAGPRVDYADSGHRSRFQRPRLAGLVDFIIRHTETVGLLS